MNNLLKFLLTAILFYNGLSCTDVATSKQDIIHLIQTKSDLEIGENFRILKDSIQHTEGAFDSDYTYIVRIEYKEQEEQSILAQISNALMDNKPNKGVWSIEETGFYFSNTQQGVVQMEPLELSIDTSTNVIDLELMHL